MSKLINNWNNNIDNYAGDQLNAGKPYLVPSKRECHSQHSLLYWNIYKLEIGNVIYDGSLF